jgi:branched-subunit amino acid transport protein
VENNWWLTLLLASAGTLLMRLLPLLWMQRHLLKQQSSEGLAAIPDWLSVLGPLMIAAMLGVSLVPGTPGIAAWLATALGTVASLLAWRWTKSIGWPVVAGVTLYGLVTVLARMAFY